MAFVNNDAVALYNGIESFNMDKEKTWVRKKTREGVF